MFFSFLKIDKNISLRSCILVPPKKEILVPYKHCLGGGGSKIGGFFIVPRVLKYIEGGGGSKKAEKILVPLFQSYV